MRQAAMLGAAFSMQRRGLQVLSPTAASILGSAPAAVLTQRIPVALTPARPYSPEPPGDDEGASEPAKGTAKGISERVLRLEIEQSHMKRSLGNIEVTLADIREGKTNFQKAQTEDMKKLKDDVHTLVIWRVRVVSVASVAGALCTAAIGLGVLYVRLASMA